MNQMSNGTSNYAHKAILDGEEMLLNAETLTSVIDELIRRHPDAGVPQVVALVAPVADAMELAKLGYVDSDSPLVAHVTAPIYSTFGSGKQILDESAKARIEGMHAKLNASGVVQVDAGNQLYGTGTRMAEVGYRTQEHHKAEHDEQISLRDAAETLRRRVKDERREDVVLSAGDLARTISVNGKVKGAGFVLTEDAIQGLLTRLEARGAWGYAQGLKSRIVAEVAKGEASDKLAIMADKAKLADLLMHECGRNPDVSLKLRARRALGDCYAIVSPSYSPADADAVIEQIVAKMPEDAKGSFSYDPKSTTWELRGEIWTPTPVAEQAVGEPFRGYVSFKSKDNGKGSLDGGGGVELLACLNAGTYVAESTDASRVHKGKILIDVDKMLASALRAIDVLCEVWGTNRQIDLRADLAALEGVPVSKAIPGLWWGELSDRKSELACLPGRTKNHVEGLTEAFWAERRDQSRIVRADFAQAYTRYIQDQPAPVRREAEAAVGSWLANPRPMTYAADRVA